MALFNFDSVMKWRGFPVKKAREVFDKSVKNYSIEQQNQDKWDIFDFHFNNNPFYHDFVGSKPDKWENVPVLTRKDLKGDPISKMPKDINVKELYSSSTSGSSGDPLYFSRDKLTHAIVWEVVRNFYSKAGVSMNDRQARMFGLSRKFTDKMKGRLKDWLADRYRFNVFDVSDFALEGWLKRFEKGSFKYIYGYTNSLVAFAQFLKDKNTTLKKHTPKLKACIVTSEVCTEKDGQIISEGFDIPIWNEYGSSEFGVMGFRRFDEKYWSIPDNFLYIEILDDNNNPLPDGELGKMTCTSLTNRATPFIRYQLGDLAAVFHKDGHTYITDIKGSLNDMAILPSGKKVPGISFYFVAQDLIEQSHNIKEFLFRQTNSGFTFEYVATEEISSDDFKKLAKGIDLHLHEKIDITPLRFDELKRGKNGKFKHFISELT